MDIDSMVEVLQAAKRGEKIEVITTSKEGWCEVPNPEFTFPMDRYRIAPKKEMTLVEELRNIGSFLPSNLCNRAADEIVELRLAVHNRDNRIEELEAALAVADEGRNYANALLSQLTKINAKPIDHYTQEELINEVRRRMG